MATRTAQAEWSGDIKRGHGTMRLGSGAFSGAYSFGSRFENEPGTNPEELIAAAHAGCFSMALSLILGNAGHVPKHIATTAKVTIEGQGDGFEITRSELSTQADVPGISDEEFRKYANTAKDGCPVSKALAGTAISLDARLASIA
jgi:lipoyl-dependent peroxiredoxin